MRFAIWTVVGLMIGLVVHFASLLALPTLASRTAFQRLADVGSRGGFELLSQPSPSESALPMPDPSIRMAVCRFDLTGGPVHVRAPTTGAFLSIAFYTPDGLGFYALTDRAASGGALELTLYTALQLAEVRSKAGPDTPEALRVEAPAARGLVVIRALAVEPGFVPEVEKRIGEASCARTDLAAQAPPRMSAL
jgi:uncharacterized membrane protein